MKTVQIPLAAIVSGDGLGSTTFPFPPFVNPTSPFATEDVALASGDVTVTVPTLPPGTALAMVVVVPPAGSAIVKKLKKVGGDAGVELGTGTPWVAFPTSLTTGGTFVLNASGIEIVRLYFY
jgi:hypothetical protein